MAKRKTKVVSAKGADKAFTRFHDGYPSRVPPSHYEAFIAGFDAGASYARRRLLRSKRK